MDNSKQSKGKGWKIATIITSIVALCGIGFGVYGMIQSFNKDSQISGLKVQVEDANNKIATLESEQNKTTNNEDVAITDSYQIFSDNLAKNYTAIIPGHYSHYTGSDNINKPVEARIENTHLTITDIDGNSPAIAEADGIISAYYIQVGNGGVPYFYLIKKDGSVARIDISENGARTIEDLDGFKEIVSIYKDDDLYAHLIDINGNTYKSL